MVATAFGAMKGQGRGRVGLLASWRAERACWRGRGWTEACRRRPCLRSTVAATLEEGDGDRASASQWGCPGASWCGGDCPCERRERGEDGCDGARACSGASSVVPVRVWHGLGVSGHVRFWPVPCSSLTKEATGQSGVLAGQPGGNRVPMEEPADPVCDRSTGPLTGGSGAPSGRPGGNRAATGHQPEKHQDDAKELRSLIRSDRPLDRAVRSVARSTGCSVELWEIILHGYREPQDPVRLTSTEFYNRQLNASARDKIRSGINRKLLDQVNDIGSAKELWDRIVVLQEGTDLIQSSLYETAKQEAHRFMIREGESIADAYARLGALRVRIKGLGAEKYDDGFEMNEGFIKSKVIAMIAVKQEDTNLALNLQIMTKSADLNSDDLVSYVAANENMAKAGKMLMAMNRVDEASHNHEASHNLALKARADHGGEKNMKLRKMRR
ncbi:hypothetical protein QYE76_012161 [Lolium multiflorum]|uniref:Uncharacterized protein n=1 Tax=Lolium multiflorum TaxID=4521 RepID=A0AAD8X6C3_LOLMU|nr:hypothetical protein QYE76_012161 [Lolium multiflorum]